MLHDAVFLALGGFFWGPGAHRGRGSQTSRRRGGDPRLESARLLSAYRVTAIDGDVGHVGGFLVDDETWALRGLIVKTRHWPSGKRVLVP